MLLGSSYTGQVWYGEINSPEGRHYYGALGSAGDLIKQMAWAINLRDASLAPVKAMMYLTTYNSDVVWSYNDGFDNQMGDPLPQVNAASVVNRWLDGRSLITTALTGIPSAVEYLRVDNANLDAAHPEALVLWNDGTSALGSPNRNLWMNGISATRTITVNATSANVILVNYLGQERTLTPVGGRITVQVGPMPIILRGRFN